MNTATIERYVEIKNMWTTMFGDKHLSLLDAEDRQTIAGMIDSDLSPENLTCDGEVRGPAVHAHYRSLIRAAQELLSIDPSVTFSELGTE
jgi:hypothetical protein